MRNNVHGDLARCTHDENLESNRATLHWTSPRVARGKIPWVPVLFNYLQRVHNIIARDRKYIHAPHNETQSITPSLNRIPWKARRQSLLYSGMLPESGPLELQEGQTFLVALNITRRRNSESHDHLMTTTTTNRLLAVKKRVLQVTLSSTSMKTGWQSLASGWRTIHLSRQATAILIICPTSTLNITYVRETTNHILIPSMGIYDRSLRVAARSGLWWRALWSGIAPQTTIYT